MLVHAARLGLAAHIDDPVERVESLAALDRLGRHELVGDPDVADVILFPQCHMLPRDWRLRAIRDHPLAVRRPEAVMVYDERDLPWCAFRGVYVSMPAATFDPRFQRTGGYLPPEPIRPSREPDLLFSLMASPTHRCRRRLFKLHHPDAVVERVDGFVFFDPGSRNFKAQRERYRSLIGRSRFVLCPRGKGTSSIRLYETLGAGRVPVVVSDEWVPPIGPKWDEICVRWPEGRTDGLVEALEEQDWQAMSAAALAAHNAFFAPEVWFDRTACALNGLLGVPPPPAGSRSRGFYRSGADALWSRAYLGARKSARRIASL
jgi:hypothetical protein